MNNKIIGVNNLSDDFQIVKDTNGKSKLALNEEIKNKLNVNNVDYYTISINSTNAEHKGTTNNNARRRLFLQGSIGYLHLDFTYKGRDKAAVQIFNLNGAPKPNGLIEIQTFDGGSIWIEDNANVVNCSGLTNGQRYIVNLVGFWRR